MAFSLPLPSHLSLAKWKVKIRDKETREPPHTTIIRGTRSWRIDLRTGRFMDDVPDPKEVSDDLLQWVMSPTNWEMICNAWDRMYPGNPVSADQNED